MGSFRKLLFWAHLGAAVLAGVVILVMSVTGVLLTYERQLNEWADAHLRSGSPASGAARLSPEALLAARAARDDAGPAATVLTMGAAADAPVVVTTEDGTRYLDAYSGRDLGERREGGLHAFLADARAWHRWFAAEGEARLTARAVTGWSNLAFLFLLLSGLYLWVPRVLDWPHVRAVLLFRRSATGKARDFNWHNVIGIWSAVPLAIVVASAVPISFPWASGAIYRAVGETPPPRRDGGAGPGRPRTEARGEQRRARTATGSSPADGGRGREASDQGHRDSAGGRAIARRGGLPDVTGLDTAWARAAADQPGWRTLSVRLPRGAADPFVFSIDHGTGGQPQLRSSLTLDRAGAVVSRERFGDQTAGRRLRSLMRFAHTGEVLGLPGQTAAGLVSAGAAVMVWTGLALSWRRARAWFARGADGRTGATTASGRPRSEWHGSPALARAVRRPAQRERRR